MEKSCANDGEYSENNNSVNSANYLFNKFLLASEWSSLNSPKISAESTA